MWIVSEDPRGHRPSWRNLRTVVLVLSLISPVARSSSIIPDNSYSEHVEEVAEEKLEDRHLQGQFQPMGYQTGPDSTGSSFAASTTMSANQQDLIIVGASYGTWFHQQAQQNRNPPTDSSTDCFVATINLSSGTVSGLSTSYVWPTASANEACNAVIMHNQDMLIVGNMEPTGVLTSLYNGGAYEAPAQPGMILQLQTEMDSSNNLNALQYVGGKVLTGSKTMNPIAASSLPADPFLFVLSMTSGSTTSNQVPTQSDPVLDLLYGKIFAMSISRYNYDTTVSYQQGTIKETLTDDGWTQPYRPSSSTADVRVRGMAHLSDKNILMVAGHTTGTGKAFGGNVTASGKDDYDGFVTLLDSESGTITTLSDGVTPASTRIKSLEDRNETVGGVCFHPTDSQFVYITGTTGGTLKELFPGSQLTNNDQAFLVKMDLQTLETVWAEQLGPLPGRVPHIEVQGISCAVTPDGQSVYMAGVVGAGGVLLDSGTYSTFGGDDVFVAQYGTQDGALNFVRQLGSDAADSVALRGGLRVDAAGNAILVGNTYGSFFRTRSPSEPASPYTRSDIFVTTIDRSTGNTAPLASTAMPPSMQLPSSPVSAPVSNPAPASIPTPASPVVPTPTASNGGGSFDLPSIGASQQDNTSSSGKGGAGGLVAALAIGSVVAVAVYCYVKRNGLGKRDAHTERGKVLQYLHQFDVEDIDLKHSATGGWHCSYTNDLAHGENNHRASQTSSSRTGLSSSMDSMDRSAYQDDNSGMAWALRNNDPLTAPLTDSKILQDSFFMDDEDGGLSSSSSQGLGLGRSEGFTDNYSNFNRKGAPNEPWGREII